PQWNHLAINLQLVVIEAVLLVPETSATERIHGVGDADEMLKKLRSHVFVNWIGLSKLERHREHRQAIESHPRRAVGLLEKSTSRERLRAIEHTDVVES